MSNSIIPNNQNEYKDLEIQTKIGVNSVLSSDVVVNFQEKVLTKVQNKHQENLVKLHNDFVNENVKLNQIHEEITRLQDQTDTIVDSALSSGLLLDSDNLNNLLASLDRESEAISNAYLNKNKNIKFKLRKHSNDAILDEEDYKEIK